MNSTWETGTVTPSDNDMVEVNVKCNGEYVEQFSTTTKLSEVVRTVGKKYNMSTVLVLDNDEEVSQTQGNTEVGDFDCLSIVKKDSGA